MLYILGKRKFQERIYILAYVVFILKTMLDSSTLFNPPELVDNIMIVMFFFCIGYKLVTQSYDIRELLILVVFGMIYIYSSYSVNYFYIFFSFLCICALQNVDIKQVLKVSVWVKSIMLSVHVIAYIVLYLVNPEVITFAYRYGVKRHFFLLGQPNTFTAYLAWTCLEIMYIYYDKLKSPHLLLIWFINLIFYRFTYSNTGTIVLTCVILMMHIEKKQLHSFYKILSFFSKYSYIICSVVFSAITILYTRLNGVLLTLWNLLNKALTGRLRYGAYAYDVYGFSILGRRLRFPGLTYWRGHWIDSLYFDNSYIWFLIVFGIIHLLIFSASFFLIEKKTSYIEKVFIITFAIYGIMEHYIVNVTICFPLLFIGKYIMNSKIDEKIGV